MKRIYIAGPMAGIPDHNRPAFHAEAARLRALGYTVVNPAEINTDPTLPWAECLKRDIPELLKCDTVALLPGWTDSKGATLEVTIATRLQIEVVLASEITYQAAA